ncbi:hypothetical protein D3C83_44900 [compost metagenome]
MPTSTEVGVMSRSAMVSAVGDTTLSRLSSLTWSGVSCGLGASCRKNAMKEARPKGRGSSRRLRPISFSISSSNSRKL